LAYDFYSQKRRDIFLFSLRFFAASFAFFAVSIFTAEIMEKARRAAEEKFKMHPAPAGAKEKCKRTED
jgi:hypothetical protein